MNGTETEVKFYVSNLPKVEETLIGLGALLIQGRIHESNLRFDTPDGALRREGKVLRLRQDQAVRMTYKGPGVARDGILSRTEVELGVDSMETARALIESLGYVEILLYEKYRRTFEYHEMHIMLDELPIGDFVEIEGQDEASIRQTAERVGLRWDAAITTSYSALFERVAGPLALPAGKLTFEAFSHQKPAAKDLAVTAADQQMDLL